MYNSVTAPNENYSRELLELHTLMSIIWRSAAQEMERWIADNDINLVGLAYRGATSSVQSTYGDVLGAEVFAASTSAAGIIADVTAGITAGFAEYSEVTVDDLLGGDPLIDVSAVCVSADTGICNGAVAEGDYDRSVDRTFEFDVTFERLAEGDTSFFTYALVDGGIVASEFDEFGGSVIPLPAAGWMLLAGIGGLAAMRRKKAA